LRKAEEAAGCSLYCPGFTFIMDGDAINCEQVSRIADDMNKAISAFYDNCRVKRVTMTVDTLMGVSITVRSDGDPHSPENLAEERRDALGRNKNAI